MRADTSSVLVQLLRLSAPVIAAMISRTVMGFVDFAMVSQLGTSAQAAIAPASLVLFSIIGFGMGAVSMVNTFVSQALGRGEYRQCSAFAWQGLYLAGLIWIVVLPPGWFGIAPLFHLIGHEAPVREMEIQYAQIGLLGIGPALAAFALSAFFTGVHRPRVPLISALIGNVFNVAANYALIYGHWGFPAMGIAGAAWATALASVVNSVVMLVWILSAHYARQYHSRTTWPLDLKRFFRLCWFGLPAGLHFAIDITTWTIFTNVFIGRFGQEQLAAHNICVQILHLSFMPAFGIGQALAVMVGKAIGQGRIDRARSAVRWALLVALGYMGSMGAIMGVFRFELVSLFNTDPQVLVWGGRIMLFCAVFQVFDAMNIVYSHALRGAGDTHWSAAAMFTVSLVVLVGGSTAAVIWLNELGSSGPWIAATATATSLGLIFAARYRWGPWEKISV